MPNSVAERLLYGFSEILKGLELAARKFNLTLFAIAFLVIFATMLLFLLPATRIWIRQRLAYFHLSRIGVSVFFYLLVFSGYGIMMRVLLTTLWGLDTNLQWYQLTWGFALAWVLGFIIPGAPGGIGIREVILASLYAQELGQGMAVGLSVVLRVITSLGDLATFALAY